VRIALWLHEKQGRRGKAEYMKNLGPTNQMVPMQGGAPLPAVQGEDELCPVLERARDVRNAGQAKKSALRLRSPARAHLGKLNKAQTPRGHTVRHGYIKH
jgi:hypothetical protein